MERRRKGRKKEEERWAKFPPPREKERQETGSDFRRKDQKHTLLQRPLRPFGTVRVLVCSPEGWTQDEQGP